MNDMDWDDDENIERWCADQRDVAACYLALQSVRFGELAEWPAWYMAPYVSVWAVESVAVPGRVGWWVICGDLPTDYASGAGVPGPRSAIEVFAKRWIELAAAMELGKEHPAVSVGTSDDAAELAPLLKSRAQLLSEWVRNDSLWEE
jgi:hypothetical protein